jgi:hypothetical protein
MAFNPQCISFNCHGTLIDFEMRPRLTDIRQLPGLLGL